MMTAKLKYTLLAVVFILGYTSLSFELIVLRQLINFVGSNTLITSIVITFILLFLSVGYYIGSVARLAGRPVRQCSLLFPPPMRKPITVDNGKTNIRNITPAPILTARRRNIMCRNRMVNSNKLTASVLISVWIMFIP